MECFPPLNFNIDIVFNVIICRSRSDWILLRCRCSHSRCQNAGEFCWVESSFCDWSMTHCLYIAMASILTRWIQLTRSSWGGIPDSDCYWWQHPIRGTPHYCKAASSDHGPGRASLLLCIFLGCAAASWSPTRASGCAPTSSSETCSRTAISPSSFTDLAQPCGPFFVRLGSCSLCCRCAIHQLTACIIDLSLVGWVWSLDLHIFILIYLFDLQNHQSSCLGQSFVDVFMRWPSILQMWFYFADVHIIDRHYFRPILGSLHSSAFLQKSYWCDVTL